MIANVLVSLTMVAYANTVPSVPCRVSHVDAAAVTEEVSLIAVPANNPKPVLDKPSKEPNVGKIIAAITLNRKITEIDCAISSSFASMIGAVAAIAEPPQIQEPTPINVEVFTGTFKILYMMYAIMSDVEIVERMMGRETNPTFPTVVRFKPKPNNMTAYCSIFLDVKLIPSCTAVLSFMIIVKIIPVTIAMMGAPITSSW